MANLTISITPATKNTPKGAFLVRCSNVNGKAISKNFSIGTLKQHEAYQKAIDAGRTLSNQYGIPFVEKTLDELIILRKEKDLKKQNKSSKKSTSTIENPLFEAFGNWNKYRSLMKLSYRQYGYDRVKFILNESLKLLDKLSESDRLELAKQQQLKKDIASSMFSLYLKTGEDMSSHIADDEAKAIYRLKVKEHKTQPEINNVYELNGETWNGKGQLPASFKTWLREDENRDVEQLKVG